MYILGLKNRTKLLIIFLLILYFINIVQFRAGSKELVAQNNLSKDLPDEYQKVDIIAKVDDISQEEIEEVSGIEDVIKEEEFAKIKLEEWAEETEVIEKLESLQGVEYAEENVAFEIAASPNDPYFAGGDQWGISQIDAPNAWDSQQGSGNIIVAVLDTGVDWDHEDIVGNIWSNTGEIADNSIDDDGNGFIDDTRGWDFVNSDNDPNDDHGHGSHVSGIIGAVSDNSMGIAGTIWNVQIMPLKMLDSSGTGSLSDAVDALDYALDNGADIVNMSWRGPIYTQSLQDKIDDLYSGNVVPVAASGNDYNNTDNWYPAAMNHVLTVGATDSSDARASFSNYGYKVEISAPGVNILSLRAGGTSIGSCSSHSDSNYKYCSGTSMAAPFVAGAAVLVWDENGALTNKQVMQILLENSDSFNPDQYSGRGRLNADNSVDNASITAGVVSQIVSTVAVNQDTPTVGETVNITVTINDGSGDPVNARRVYIQSSRGSTDTILPSSENTNVSGIANFTLESTTSGELYLTAFDDNGTPADTSDDLTISFMPTVEYQAGDLDHFGFSTIGDKKSQTSFSITLYAKDQYSNTATNFSDTVSISDLSSSLSVSQSGTFSSGSWTGSVQVSSYKINNKITVSHSGKSGESNIFNVTHPNAQVISISPNYSYNSWSRYEQAVKVNGLNFRSGIEVNLTKSGQSDVSCSSVNVVSSTELTCDINTNGYATRNWNLYVKNYGISTSGNSGINYFNVFRRSDLNTDWSVDIFDFSQLLGEWNRSGDRISDVNGDSSVDLLDFSAMLGEWAGSY